MVRTTLYPLSGGIKGIDYVIQKAASEGFLPLAVTFIPAEKSPGALFFVFFSQETETEEKPEEQPKSEPLPLPEIVKTSETEIIPEAT